MDRDTYFNALLRAMIAGAQVVREAEFDGWEKATTDDAEFKADGTFVTDTDRASEAMIMSVMGKLEGLRIRGEEGSSAGEGSHLAIFDPLDGTADFLIGGINSTVGGGLLDENGRLYTAVTVLPADGHVVVARPHGKTELHRVYLDSRGRWSYHSRRIRDLHVSQGEMSLKSVVFIDHTHGFVSQGTPVLNDLETALFAFGMARHFTIRKNGSNLYHQMMVAGGRHNVAASVTLAKGGDHDLIGVAQVLGAGGVARGYNIERNSRDKAVFAAVEDVLKISNYKILITAASRQILDLVEHVLGVALYDACHPEARNIWGSFLAKTHYDVR